MPLLDQAVLVGHLNPKIVETESVLGLNRLAVPFEFARKLRSIRFIMVGGSTLISIRK